MNYINQINTFYRIAGSVELKPSARMLYLALLHKNNQLAWIESFTCTATELEGFSGLGPSGLQRARQVLVAKGLITYAKRGANRAPRYSIFELTDDRVQFILNDTPGGTASGMANDTPNDTAGGMANTLTKSNQTRSKQDDDDGGRQKVFTLWQELWGFPNAIAVTDIDHWISDVGSELLAYAIEVAGKRNVSASGADRYIERVVSRWQDLKVTTLAEAQSANEAHEQRVSNAQRQRGEHGRVKETLPDWAQDGYVPPKPAPKLSPEQRAKMKAQLERLNSRDNQTEVEK
ncbi:DnaD domain protein [Secundilactobacillus kimchicus]|uniref:DnaD domain protein n=1 Tax=Secundilactobacillus kimchicus TaxID=528209 RepID=UPI0024A88F87|nr:DnaD domain protein [Secundilactobacillus kimchicus]